MCIQWSCFVWSFTTQVGGSFFHPPTTHLMQSPSRDEVPTVSTTSRRTFSVIKFPYDANRHSILHQFFLYTLYRVFRYQWNTHGIASFLDNCDRHSIALANFAAWDEYAERITDELDHSPVAGALDSAIVPIQHAPVWCLPLAVKSRQQTKWCFPSARKKWRLRSPL